MKFCSYKIGYIVEITDGLNDGYKYITIAKDPNDIYTYTKLVYSEQTLVLDWNYEEISVDDLRLGDLVVSYHSNAMTMSIPPQTTAYIIKKLNRN